MGFRAPAREAERHKKMQRKAHDAEKPQQPDGCEDFEAERNAAMRFL